ncbi:MAG: alpha-galactosidase [Victivallaceae bacterium]|nr:alpha-galactosidase [Victivallaceae bacterium]
MAIVVGENGQFVVGNTLFRRELKVDEYGLRTISIVNRSNGREYVRRPDAAEFQVTLNGQLTYSYHKPEYHILDGNLTTADAEYKFIDSEIISGSAGSEILKLTFNVTKVNASVKVCYEVYPDMPGAAKWLEFTAENGELHIKQLFFEVLNCCPGEFVDADFYLKHGSVRSQPMFATSDEDIVQVHNRELNEGLYIGNTAPGPMRHFMVYPNWTSGISCGYNMSSADFNVYLPASETFVSGRALMMLYQGMQDEQNIRNRFREMVRRELPVTADNGEPMYCTWVPFMLNINEALLLDLAERAAKLGFKYFVIDDGWFISDNWTVDRDKFPNGLEVIADRVKALGMKFGLWYNIGNDYGAPGTRPEDNALDFHNEGKSFGFAGKYTTRCMASKHRDFVIDKLTELTERYNVDYFKLDFSSVCSPYGMMPYGCHSTEHAYHRDYSDSAFEQYRAMFYFKNSMKERYPELVIDFSFETFGTEAPSIGALQLSELHHITNLNTMQPKVANALKIRNTIYNFSNLLPVERILGSLICIEGEHGLENFLTPFTGAPLAAGDLRTLSTEDIAAISAVSSAWETLNQAEQLTSFYRLRGSKYIENSDWDGFARFNSIGNGMLFIFKNGYAEAEITLQLDYAVQSLTFCDTIGNELGTYSAEQLKASIAVDWLQDVTCRAVVFEAKK